MIVTPELKKPSWVKISLLKEYSGNLPECIEIPAQQLGAGSWKEMIEQTQLDGIERVVIVGVDKNNEIITSRIFPGIAEGNSSPASVSAPFLPHGLKFLLPPNKDITSIHSHPKPHELDHLQTTLITDGDIRSFDNSKYKAMVMIDKGGVHVLLRSFPDEFESQPLPELNLHEAALTKAKEGGNTVAEAISALAKLLERYGISYYYSSNLSPTNESRVRLQDARSLIIPDRLPQEVS